MIDRAADPRTEDTIAYELLSTQRGGTSPQVVGRATFRGGRTVVEAPEAISIAVEEQLGQAFVDRVQSDERPRGYRRSGHGMVERLVPGMAEHFIARMRGLWLSYPDGTVVTAREALGRPRPGLPVSAETRPDLGNVGAPVMDPAIRRATLAGADDAINARPLVRTHAPDTGLREGRPAPSDRPVSRTDCGWIV